MKGSLPACTLLATFFSTQLFAVTVSVQITPARCGLANGSVIAIATGGIPPYSYSWSTGATSQNISDLLPGDYTVTVTDGLANTDQTIATVTNIQELVDPFANQVLPGCAGSCTGWASIWEAELQGTAPYNYTWPNPYFQAGSVIFMGVCPWIANPVNVSDANGCTGSFDISVMDVPMMQPTILGTTPACGGQANGSATLGGIGTSSYMQVQPLAGGSVQTNDTGSDPWTVTGLAAGTYDVILWDQFGYPPFFTPGAVYCTVPAQFTITSIPGPCGSISGRVYHDADQNCVFNGFDLAQPYRVITIDPIGAYGISDALGHYEQNLNYGNYDLSQTAVPNETQICPAISPQPLTIDAVNDDVITDFANLSSVPHDLSLNIWSNTARPGFPTRLCLHITNTTAFPSGNVSLDLAFDPLLLNPVPVDGHWDLGVLAPYASQHVHFEADVPANINLLGTVMNYSATVTNTATESSLANNSAALDVTITGSYDPNDKQGTTSSGLSPSQYFLAQDEWIDYTVRFQNTGTASAETVVIRDTIDTDFSIPSLEILGASHAFTPSFGFDDPRELIFTFDNIDLPDSTSDALGSQGFISFRIKPNSNVVVGTLLENTAGIYFDFNPPIITNTVTHVVDFSTGMQGPFDSAQGMRLLPNPASDVVNVILPDGSDGTVRLLAIDGRVMNVPVMRRNDGVQLDVRSLPRGMYTVRTMGGAACFMKN